MILDANRKPASRSKLHAVLFNCTRCVFVFSEHEVTFPVRMTRPVTPLLYISHNQSELLELRKHVFIKDAHEGKGWSVISDVHEQLSIKIKQTPIGVITL